MNKLIGITIGDIDGIGIELLIRLWKKKEIKNFFLITNDKLFKKYLDLKKTRLKIKHFNQNEKINNNFFYIYNIDARINEVNTINSLKESYKLAKKGICYSIINLPLNKEKIINIDRSFMGQTEFYQKLDNKNISNMIFYSKKIIIFTLSTHIPLNKVVQYLKKKNLIFNKIKNFNKTLKQDFNIKKPKIIIAGINPHAGENGKLGKDEIRYLEPEIKKLQNINIDIRGPYSADTLFNNKNIENFDAFICNYHDQALIPLKIISGFNAINFTGSLSIIRLSPDHGTAYNLIGKNIANENSLKNCFIASKKIFKNRNMNVET